MASAEPAAPPAQACIDRGAAQQFLSLLGKNPASARLRAFPHRANPAKGEIGARKGLQPLRVAVTGSPVSPPLFESMAAIGRDATLRRIRSAAARLS